MKNFLLNIYENFLEEQDYWCEIVNSQFSNSQYKQYDNKHYTQRYIEQYYLLKYAPLYFEEYYEIYYEFLKHYKKEDIRILSIGVGAGLDFWGFTDVIVHLNKSIDVDYIGIDLVDWKYRFKDIRFLQKSLDDLSYEDFNNFTRGTANVIIFPKSIIEMDISTIKKLANFLINTLSNKYYVNRDIWFIISYIKKGSKISGIDKFKIIYDIFIENNYQLVHGNIDKHNESIDKEHKIIYPFDYKNSWMKNIQTYCYSKCNQIQIKKCSLVGQYPMLYKKHIAYGIYNFKMLGTFT
jgi:hypothetical protein